MNRKLIYLVFLFVFLAGCAAPTPAIPTVDANLIATGSVKTFQAQLTADASNRPSDTPQPPAAPAATETLGPVAPTNTLEPIVLSVPDKATLLAQKPVDGAELQKGEGFDMVWTVQNTGTTTWTRNRYALRYYAGMALGEKGTYLLPQDVPPGESINLVVDMVAPDYLGEYSTVWVLTNADGVNFYEVNATLRFIVGPTKTFTVTPGPSLTPSDTPTFLP